MAQRVRRCWVRRRRADVGAVIALPRGVPGADLMTTLRVWAPHASEVMVDIAGTREPMLAEPNDWWTTVLELEHGTDYGYVLDGRDPLPDPRSAWQPHGVHGLSRSVDHSAFEWHDGKWRGVPLLGGLVYELHIGTFTREGTFDAAIERLDHLVDIGIDLVEVLPVSAFPGRH